MLITSHPAYEDKSKEFKIESGEIGNIEFVLNPLPVINVKNKRK
jgi:hypothetical protein